jgi:hypothetical protein
MQWVWIGSQASEILPVASGVVQGSVLLYHVDVDITCMRMTYNFTSELITHQCQFCQNLVPKTLRAALRFKIFLSQEEQS